MTFAKSKSKLYYDRQSVRLSFRHPSGIRDQFFFLHEIFFRRLRVCYFVAPSLTRGRACNCCCWSSPAQFRGSQDHILLSQFLRLSQTGGPGPRIYIPQEQGGPVIPPGTGFSFCRLLRLTGLRWRYPIPPPHGKTSAPKIKIKVILRQTVSQSVCRGVKFTLELVITYYFLFESCYVVCFGRPLWREVGSVSCQSLSSVFSPLSNIQYNLHCTCYMF
jgi:hypothetical protein